MFFSKYHDAGAKLWFIKLGDNKRISCKRCINHLDCMYLDTILISQHHQMVWSLVSAVAKAYLRSSARTSLGISTQQKWETLHFISSKMLMVKSICLRPPTTTVKYRVNWKFATNNTVISCVGVHVKKNTSWLIIFRTKAITWSLLSRSFTSLHPLWVWLHI